MARRRKSNNPAGRPVTVGGDSAAVVLSVRIPSALRKQSLRSATVEGLTASEWWRRAGTALLERTRTRRLS